MQLWDVPLHGVVELGYGLAPISGGQLTNHLKVLRRVGTTELDADGREVTKLTVEVVGVAADGSELGWDTSLPLLGTATVRPLHQPA